MFSAVKAESNASKLNKLLAVSGNSAPEYEKFNVQFLGGENFGDGSEDKIPDDFINDCAIAKLSLNCRLVLNYLYYNHKYKNNKLRTITHEQIATDLGNRICVKTVGNCVRLLKKAGLIVSPHRSQYQINFDVIDDADYFYINKLWFNEVFEFAIGESEEKLTVKRKLTLHEVLQLSVLSRHYSYNNDFFKSSQRNIAKYINCAASTAGNGFRALESGGLLRRFFMSDGKTYDTLGVNSTYQTHFVLNEKIVELAKRTQSDATKRSSKYKNDKAGSDRRIAAFTMLNYPQATKEEVRRYAEIYLNRVKEQCKNDFTYQKLKHEQREVIELYNAGEINGSEGGRRLTDILRQQRAYLEEKGLPAQALELQYQERRAQWYVVRKALKKSRPPKRKLIND